jgi:hypothetical protein
MSLLLYQLNKDHVHHFVSDRANMFLVEFFAANNGLTITDPNFKKPACRGEVLESLLCLGEYCYYIK